ncbi:MAG TPA: phosphatase PAP2 family protein [Patescibacteria group bacterium]|nr:phosphatase PAP2 family protein [Patescibacteria group bacterium]
MLKNPSRVVGLIGAVIFLVIFVHAPSFPTPDKLLVFATFVAMIFAQAKELLRRFVPFVALLLVYESFRGIVPHLNSHVNYSLLIHADKLLFWGHLPTTLLQNWLWQGHVSWYDFVFYLAYMLHFVLPFVLAIFIWKLKESSYWQFVTTYLVVSFMGFLTFLLFPAAPPWMASDRHIIEPIVRISSNVWFALGIHDFPSFYNKISPNPVAAVPSLHAAYSFLFALFITKLFKSKYRWLAWIYPLLIWVGTVYQGEHYAIDAIIGVLYAWISYLMVKRYFSQRLSKNDKMEINRSKLNNKTKQLTNT